MSIDLLTDKLFDFWNNWGCLDYSYKSEDQLKNEIYEHLKTSNGINKEIKYLNNELENGYDENSLEYKDIENLINLINMYKEESD